MISIGSLYFITNPYPANRQNEKINIIFDAFKNVTIKNELNDNEIKANEEYSDIDSIKFIPGDRNGIYYIYFTSTRQDELDGKIVGINCKIPINTPECLYRCDSCVEKGTEEHHQCL